MCARDWIPPGCQHWRQWAHSCDLKWDWFRNGVNGLQLYIINIDLKKCQPAARRVLGPAQVRVNIGSKLVRRLKIWINCLVFKCSSPGDSHSILGIRHRDGGVVSDPGEPVPLVGEAHPVHPPAAHRGVGELGHQLPDRHLLSPRRLAWTLLNVLDEPGEHSDLEISWSACQKDIVGVPVQRRHGRLQGFLDVLRHPPKQQYYRPFLGQGKVTYQSIPVS